MTDRQSDPPTLDYTKKPSPEPPNPWESGWRSWVLTFFGEFIAQIILPIFFAVGVIVAVSCFHRLFH